LPSFSAEPKLVSFKLSFVLNSCKNGFKHETCKLIGPKIQLTNPTTEKGRKEYGKCILSVDLTFVCTVAVF